MYPFLENIFWILVGAIITRILDKPIERYQRGSIYWLRGVISRFRGVDVVSAAQEEFRVSKWHAEWVVVEGSSSDPCTPGNVVCQFDPTPLVLPPDRQQKKNQIEQDQTELGKIVNKPRKFYNGPTVALAEVGGGQIGLTEEPLLFLRFRPSDYYTYLATAGSLNDQIEIEPGRFGTVRDKYLRNLNYKSPIPEFASSVSINLSLITSDGFIVMSKRASEGVLGFAGNIVCPVGENINPDLDRDTNGAISLFNTAKRGANYELNIEIAEDELLFFTIGADIKLHFYEVTGLIRSKAFSRHDILSRRSLGSKEKWESTELYFLHHDPVRVAKFMSDTSKTAKWSPGAIVCLTQTMMLEFGKKTTERVLSKYPPFNPKES